MEHKFIVHNKIQEQYAKFILDRKRFMAYALPTGLGKTYNAIQVICNNIETIPEKIVFLANSHKLLPYEEIKSKLRELGYSEEKINTLVLRVYSNKYYVEKYFQDIFEKRLPNRFKKDESFQELYELVCKFNLYEQEDNIDISIKKDIMRDLEEKIDKVWREIRVKLRNEFKEISGDKKYSKKIALELIRNNKEYKWIQEINPVSNIYTAKIIIMTMQKALFSLDTLVEKPYYIYEHEDFKDAIIFIDEIDSTKQTILQNIVDIKNNSYLDIFKFMDILRQKLKEVAELFVNNNDSSTYKKIVNECKFLVEKYNLTKPYKNKDVNFHKNNVLFQSVLNTCSTRENQYCYVVQKEDYNEIMVSDIEPNYDDKTYNIKEVLNSINRFAKFFRVMLHQMSSNYMYVINKSKQDLENKFEHEDAIYSLADMLNIDKWMDFLRKTDISYGKKQSDLYLNNDQSFYKRGFKVTRFYDSPKHEIRTKILLLEYLDTPEKLLLKMCNHCRIIGISATATIKSVIGNYALDYIKDVLDDDYYEITDESRRKLEDHYNESINGYKDNIFINTKIYDFKCKTLNDIEKSLRVIFENEDEIEYFKDQINKKYLNAKAEGTTVIEELDYSCNGFLKLVNVVKDFILNDNLQSFLSLTNSLVGKGKSYDEELLIKITNAIIEENNLQDKYKADNMFFMINSQNFEIHKSKLLERLANGEKIMILSSYSTLSKGINLQYDIPKSMENYVVVNDFKRNSCKKDIDGIYLENPTHIIVNLLESKSDNDITKGLYESMYLLENGEINNTIASNRINNLLNKRLRLSERSLDCSIKDAISINNVAIQIINQSIGRISRTNIKNKEIFIALDRNLKKRSFDDLEDEIMISPELKAIINKLKDPNSNYKKDELKRKQLINLAINTSLKNLRWINEMKSGYWEYDKITFWEQLRKIVLGYPTLSKSEYEELSPVFKQFYIKMDKPRNSYSYTQSSNYRYIKLDFSELENYIMASSKGARLDVLMSNESIKNFFVSQQYATEFKVGDYMISPVIYNNIYKGAIGEKVVNFILKYFKLADPKKMPQDIFEKFDADLGNGIYLDAKFWNINTPLALKKSREWVKNKLNECNGKRAIIINVFPLKNVEKIVKTVDGSIVEINGLLMEDGSFDNDLINALGGYFNGY